MNPATCGPGDVIEEGAYCRVLLGVDYRKQIPAQSDFFASRGVGQEDKKKMHATLRQYSRSGPSPNPEKYERFADLHYLKIHGFRAFCFERRRLGGRELIVCHICPKKTNRALSDDYENRARRTFHQHCEVYCS